LTNTGAIISYDEQPARRIAALSGTPEMRAQRARVIELLAPQPGERVLDIGCGPGHLVREIADLVEPGGSAVGVDISQDMLRLAAEQGAQVMHTPDIALPLDSRSIDAAVATQVYEFVADLPAALAELHRVLRPGGRAVILDTDWDSLVWHSSDPIRMQQVIDGWRSRTADPCLPRTLTRLLRDAGLRVTRRQTFTIFDVSGAPGSYSTHQIEHLGASAIDVDASIVEAWANDLRARARDDDYFFSLNRYLFLAAKE